MKPKTFLVSFLLILCLLSFLPILIQALTVGFSTVNITSVHTCPLDERTFVIVYMDETNADVSFQIYDTNGTQVLAETDLDTTAGSGGYSSVSVSAFNSTCFVIGWFDAPDNDMSFAVYNSTGSLLTNPIDVDTSSSGYTVSVTAFNSTHFVIGWYAQWTNYYADYAVYNSGGTKITGPIVMDNDIGSLSFSVCVSALNETYFAMSWYDYTDKDATFAVCDSSGNNITGAIDADTDVGNAYSTWVSALNSTYFVVAWQDMTDQDTTFSVYDSGGTQKSGPIDADTSIGTTAPRAVRATTLNETLLCLSWYDYEDFDLSYRNYWSNGTALTSLTDIESWPTAANIPFRYNCPCSQATATNIKLYNDNWIIAYANTTTQAIWQAFMPNGTAWDGTIPSQEQGQNLAFNLAGNILASVSTMINKELAFLQTNTIMPNAVVSMSKAISGILTEYLSTNSIYPSATLLFNKELAFWKYENFFTSATSTMTKALKITLYELFDFVLIHASNIMVPTWLAMTIDVAAAIGVLALVLAITGISLVVLRKRRE